MNSISQSSLFFKLKADSLFAEEQFYDAYLNYERAQFVCNDNDFELDILLEKIQALKKLGMYSQSIEDLNRFPIFLLDSSQKIKVFQEIALCAYLDGQFYLAESKLVQLKFLVSDDFYFHNYQWLYVLSLNEIHKYDEAFSEMEKWLQTKYFNQDLITEYMKKIGKQYDKKNIPKIKDPEKAEKWSTFIPGSGQMYSGHAIDGVFNASMQLGSLVFAVERVISGFYLTGYFGGFAIFQKFYFGGVARAKYLADKRNFEAHKSFNEQVKQLVLQIHQAQKKG